jgi:hypothetical protein
MKKFSIQKSWVFAFQAYKKHFALLCAVGITVGTLNWAQVVVPQTSAKYLGFEKRFAISYESPKTELSSGEVLRGSTSPKVIDTITVYSKRVYEGFIKSYRNYTKNASTAATLFLLFLWVFLFLFKLFLQLGLIRVVLDLKDKGSSSYCNLFSAGSLLPTYLGANLLFWIVASIVMGVSVLGIYGSVTLFNVLFDFFNISSKIMQSLGIYLLVLLSVFTFISIILRYAFFQFFIIDKKLGSFNSLFHSYSSTKGNVGRLFLLMVGVILFSLLVSAPLGYLLGATYQMDLTVNSFVYTLFNSLFSSFYYLTFAHAYRKLAS